LAERRSADRLRHGYRDGPGEKHAEQDGVKGGIVRQHSGIGAGNRRIEFSITTK